jgi:hypothetical protein
VPGRAQRLERALVIGRDDGGVRGRRDDRLVGQQQVDLRTFALHPDDPAQRRRRLDALESEQLPERDDCSGILWPRLE